MFSTQPELEEGMSTDDYKDSDLEDAVKSQFSHFKNLGINSVNSSVEHDPLNSIFDEEFISRKSDKAQQAKIKKITLKHESVYVSAKDNIFQKTGKHSIKTNKLFDASKANFLHDEETDSLKNASAPKSMNTLKLGSNDTEDFKEVFMNTNNLNAKPKPQIAEDKKLETQSKNLFSLKTNNFVKQNTESKQKPNIIDFSDEETPNVNNEKKENKNFSTSNFFAIPKKGELKSETKKEPKEEPREELKEESINERLNKSKDEPIDEPFNKPIRESRREFIDPSRENNEDVFEFSFGDLIMKMKSTLKEPKVKFIHIAFDEYLSKFDSGYTIILITKYISRFMISDPENGEIYLQKLYTHVHNNWDQIIHKYDEYEQTPTEESISSEFDERPKYVNKSSPSKKLITQLAYYKIFILNRMKKTDAKYFKGVHKQLHQQLLICLNAHKNDGLSATEKAEAINKIINAFKYSEIVDRGLCKEILLYAKEYVDYLERDDLISILKYARNFESSHRAEVQSLKTIFKKRIEEIENQLNINTEEVFLTKVKNFNKLIESQTNKDIIEKDTIKIFNDFRNKLKKTQEDYREMTKMINEHYNYWIENEHLLNELGFLIPMLTDGFKPKDKEGKLLLNKMVEKEEHIYELLKLDEMRNIEETQNEVQLKKIFSKIND